MEITNLDEAKKHDEAWMSAYNDFILKYEKGNDTCEGYGYWNIHK